MISSLATSLPKRAPRLALNASRLLSCSPPAPKTLLTPATHKYPSIPVVPPHAGLAIARLMPPRTYTLPTARLFASDAKPEDPAPSDSHDPAAPDPSAPTDAIPPPLPDSADGKVVASEKVIAICDSMMALNMVEITQVSPDARAPPPAPRDQLSQG